MEIPLLELAELAQKIGVILQKHGIPYHLTGGVVASHYGETRNTQDVDIVIDFSKCRNKNALFTDLKSELYVDRRTFDEAIQTNSMFQVLDIESVLRADIYVKSVLPQFPKNVSWANIAGDITLPICSPEDSILSKLVWIKLGSGRSRKDVVAMLRVQENLDNEYLEATAVQLDVKPILDELRKIAENYDPHVIL
ncbi:MAG: hypothetical protein FWC43_06885 [Planctomycetaceae bacterium]|nr:hypothetical protein [Planctomycetaceae bacterium]